jgi:Glycosyl hydrolase family 14
MLVMPLSQSSMHDAPCVVAAGTVARSSRRHGTPCPVRALLSSLLAAGCTPQALRDGLKALAGLGVWGVSVNVWWGVVEQEACSYDWGPMAVVLSAAREAGLRVRVSFCFHADERHALPAWVLAAGRDCPDIFPTDRAGNRSMECLSIGVDHGVCLARLLRPLCSALLNIAPPPSFLWD